jgi:hypothetical protein
MWGEKLMTLRDCDPLSVFIKKSVRPLVVSSENRYYYEIEINLPRLFPFMNNHFVCRGSYPAGVTEVLHSVMVPEDVGSIFLLSSTS